MELIVLDTSLKMLSVLDTFESLIWTERYSAYGDFEVYTSINDSILEILKDDYYLWLKESDQTMIVEDRKIESDAENGNHFTVTGRSLESILERRIIWKQMILSGNFQNGIKKLLDENIINPSDASRKVERLIFEASTDPAITGLTVDAQFTGDNLYDAIKKLCDSKNIGFRIKLSDDNKFVFKLYAGADRSYDQFTNPYVIFSPKFENVINTNYLESKKTLKTVTLVAGEGEGADRKTTTVACSSGAGTGLNRRELYTDARDVSSTVDNETLTDAEYKAQLSQRGLENLAENIATKSFSKFYDNIIHEIAKRELLRLFDDDEFIDWLLTQIFDGFKIDVSYMTDEEYATCMTDTFNKLEYRNISESKLTGEKWMEKSVNIGDQLSQVIGIYYPYRIDNYVKYVRSQKFYGRYMDDWYIMNPSKEELLDLLDNIHQIAEEYGIHINRKKTRIVKISSTYKFLQIKYSLTDSGKVIKRINPKRVTAMRRKLKRLAVKVKNEEISYENVENMFRSWMGGFYKLLSKEQRKNLIGLYEDLFEKSIEIVNKKMIIVDKTR